MFGLNARVAVRKLDVTENHAARRLQFAQNYVDRPIIFWEKTIIMDEKTFGYLVILCLFKTTVFYSYIFDRFLTKI